MARGEFGERLKREREMREVSIDELTNATRISTRFIQALENEDWEKLPGGVFGHGFVRSIARYLGLNEEALLADYDLTRAETIPPADARVEDRIPSPPKWVPALAVVLILLTMVGLFFAGRYSWRRFAAHRARKPSLGASVVVGQPAEANSAGSTDPAAMFSPDHAAGALDLCVSTSTPTRVRILADGKPVLDAHLPGGQTRHFSANEKFEVTAEDSSAVLLELNGQAMPPVGAPGASGTIILSHKDLRQAPGGNAQF